jgi:DNA-binding PadR family transcriptional regulator
MHIYALRQEINELTGHGYYPTHSTLKRSIGTLLAAGFIEDCHSNPHYWLKAKRGAPYELTERGRKRIDKELAMYFRLCQVARISLRQHETA